MMCLAVHADWSVDPAKRWMSVARRRDGRWRVEPPEPVGEPAILCERLLDRAAGGAVALGVDFPLGLPRHYATMQGIPRFDDWLRRLDPADQLLRPCATLDEVNPARPFYPLKSVAGRGQMARHAAALGFEDAYALRRAVDFRTARRPAGAPLFWTMGANQCGKAAISGWRDCLMPAFARRVPIRLWPFEGRLAELLAPGRLVIAETYPAEAMVQTGLRLKGSKRRQIDRAAMAPALLALCEADRHEVDERLRLRIADGFGPRPDDEDPFDSLLGLLAVIRAVSGAADGTESGLPGGADVIRAVEGWVLGQVDPPIIPECA